MSLSSILDLAAREWLKNTEPGPNTEAEQQRLHGEVSKLLGAFASGQTRRAENPGVRSASVCEPAVSDDSLIDTGAILALLDKSDRWHPVCTATFRQLHLPLITSEAVLTELFHLIGDSRTEMEAAWKFARSGALLLQAIEDSELHEIHTLMSRYSDRPMDFADATLVHLARRESVSSIFTVDGVISKPIELRVRDDSGSFPQRLTEGHCLHFAAATPSCNERGWL